MARQGFFIVFDGINGCGKGTQLALATEWLYDLDRSHLILRTREPNLLDQNGEYARKELERNNDPHEGGIRCVQYFTENSRTHNNALLKPFLEQANTFVLQDRYRLSTAAFQSAQGVPLEEIIAITRKAGLLIPDLTLVFDLPAAVAKQRLDARDNRKNRKFDKDPAFLEQVRLQYLKLAKAPLFRDYHIAYIDADRSREAIFKDVQQRIGTLLYQKKG